MSDFLTRLAQRQLGQVAPIKPNFPPLFASRPGKPDASSAREGEIETHTEPAGAKAPSTAVVGAPELVGSGRAPAMPEPPRGVPREEAATARPVSAQARRVPKASGTAAPPPDRPEPVVPKSQEESSEPKPSVPISLPRAHARMETILPDDRQRAVALGPYREGLPGAMRIAPRDASALPLESSMFGSRGKTPAPPRLIENQDARPAAHPVAAPERVDRSKPARARPGATAREAPPFARDETTVSVTIGRIEVTAVTEAAPAKRGTSSRKPALSLGDYLVQRRRGER